MTPQMREFLQAYADWAYLEEATDNPYGFAYDFGLCHATTTYSVFRDVLPNTLRGELRQMFLTDGLDVAYPFGEFDFNNRPDLATCPNRRSWVLSKLGLVP